MKRKLVKQGGTALTVSLPAKWARKYNLKAGDEVEGEEEDWTLIVSLKSFKKQLSEKRCYKQAYG